LKEVSVFKAAGSSNHLKIGDRETVTDSEKGPEEVPFEHNPDDPSACSGFRVRLRLEQRLLRFRDGSGFW